MASNMKDKPLRAMIVGDSMTQGGEGDYTWRYRLWEWTRSEHANIVFTGPYKGTQEPDEPSPPKPPPLYKTWEPEGPVRCHGGYAKGTSEDFDSHHFSVWGRQCAVDKDLIEDVVRHHSPDLLLVMLGFNDIGWFVSDAKGTLESMNTFVANARQANPKLDFAIANIPQRTKMDGRDDLPKKTDEFNDLLKHAVKSWSDHQSHLYLVDVCKEYTAESATFDGLHPNSLGDFQIARAFSSTLLHDFKLGRHALAIPKDIPVRPLPPPTGFQLVSSPVGVTAVWDQVYGAFGYEFRSRINDGEFSAGPCGANRWDSHWAAEGDVYEAQVRSLYGNQARSDWTPLISATSHPQLPPPPANIVVKNAKQGVTVTWDPPSGHFSHHIIQYSIIWKDKHVEAMFPSLGGFKESPAHIDELEDGHTYDIGMLTWSQAGEGRLGAMQEFKVDNSKAEA